MQAIRLAIVVEGLVMGLLASAAKAKALGIGSQLQPGSTGCPAHPTQSLIRHRHLVIHLPSKGPNCGPAAVPIPLMPALAFVPCTAARVESLTATVHIPAFDLRLCEIFLALTRFISQSLW